MGCMLLFQPAQGGGEQIGRCQAERNGVAAFAVVITGGEIRNVSGAVEIHGEIEVAHAVYVSRARMSNCAAWVAAATPSSSVTTSIRPEKPCSRTFSWALFKHAREQSGGFHCATCAEIQHAEQFVSRCQYPSC